MWLLNVETEQLEYFVDQRSKKYAILSHTWEDDEVTFHDVRNGTAKHRNGYQKIVWTCKQARSEDLDYVWVDTACINKESSAELSEAINSMYNYYAAASVCYAYLIDAHQAVQFLQEVDRGLVRILGDDGNGVPDPRSPSWDEQRPIREQQETVYEVLQLQRCKWFRRGWTLQELLAPSDILFVGPNWEFLGDKQSLATTIAVITGIDVDVLRDRRLVRNKTIAMRMSWAAKRQTSRIEDRAYSLLGIFDINMPMLYGEGENAFLRLQKAIIDVSTDLSILAWGWCMDFSSWRDSGSGSRLFATSPDDFARCSRIVPWDKAPLIGSYRLHNTGLEIDVDVATLSTGPLRTREYFAVLNCRSADNVLGPLALPITARASSDTNKVEGSTFFCSKHLRRSGRTVVIPLEAIQFAERRRIIILTLPEREEYFSPYQVFGARQPIIVIRIPAGEEFEMVWDSQHMEIANRPVAQCDVTDGRDFHIICRDTRSSNEPWFFGVSLPVSTLITGSTNFLNTPMYDLDCRSMKELHCYVENIPCKVANGVFNNCENSWLTPPTPNKMVQAIANIQERLDEKVWIMDLFIPRTY